MKKLVLATAVAALSVSAAQAAPTVYGKAFLTLDTTDGETTTTTNNNSVKVESSDTKLNSNSSRIGFKGSEALTANTDVVYKLEYGVKVDDGVKVVDGTTTNANFSSRDTYLGLSNKQLGTVLAGRLTTIDDYVDFADVLEGSNVAGDVAPTFNEPRANNALAYVSPSNNGLTFLGMYAFDSDTDSNSLDDKDQYGVAAKYSSGPVNLGASYIAHGDNNHARVSGNYTLNDALTLGALYQISEFEAANSEKENSVIVSAELATATPWSYYAQVNMVDNVAGADDAEAMGVGIGSKYAFSKSATGHIYGGYANNEITADNVKTESDSFGIGAGLEYKF